MLITFEGAEGGGKTTQITLLAQFLRQQGFSVSTTRQPGGTDIGQQIRNCLHDVKNSAMTAEAEILLYAADRAQHTGQFIRPALANGEIVLCDRYTDSTMAYQGYGRGLDLDTLTWVNTFATGGLQPDLTFLLDVDVVTGLQRRRQGELEMNRMDQQTIAFYERVKAGFAQLVAETPERWIVVDANRALEVVQAELQVAVLARLQKSQADAPE